MSTCTFCPKDDTSHSVHTDALDLASVRLTDMTRSIGLDPDAVCARISDAIQSTQEPSADERVDTVDAVMQILCEPCVTEAGIVVVAIALTNVHIRDTVVWDISHLDTETLPDVLANLIAIGSAIPDEYSAPVCTVMALVSWFLGDTPYATCAALNATLSRPDGYSLADLLLAALASGLPADDWRNNLPSRDICLGLVGEMTQALPQGGAQ